MTTTLVLGGGFGGIAAANRLRELLPAEHTVAVYDRARDFHVGAGKTWVVVGATTVADISQRRRALLAPGVELCEVEVEAIHLADRTVTAGGAVRAWDHLVIALGAELDLGAVPGLDAALTFYTLAGAERLRDALADFAGGDLVLLIPRAPFKCPPAPYEAAMMLHAHFAERGVAARIAIHTVEGAPMTTAGPEMGQMVRAELAARGIALHTGKKTARVDGAARRVSFEDGSEVGYDLLVAVPPHAAPALVREAGLVGPSGWIPVDPQTLQVAGAVGVFAIGDVTTVPLPGRFRPDVPLVLPKAGVFAAAQGRVAAEQIAARVVGAEASRFDGRGHCYLEVGGGKALRAEGEFFATPAPRMRAEPPSEEQQRDKAAWIAERLAPIGA